MTGPKENNPARQLHKSIDTFFPWQKLFLAAPTGIAIVGMNAYYQEANSCFLELLGYSADEIKYVSIFDLTHPSDREELEEGLRCVQRGELVQFRYLKRIQQKSGAWLWVCDTISLMHGDEEQTSYYISVLEDRTENLKTEQALRASEERLRATITYSSIGVTLISLEGTFIDVNPAFAAMLGRSVDEVLLLNVATITHPDHLDQTMQKLGELVSGKLPFFRLIKRYMRKDGSYIWAQSTVSLTRDSAGQPVHIVAMTEDITDRRKMEEGLRQSQEQLAMAVNVAKVGFFDWNIPEDQVSLSEQLRSDLGVKGRSESFSIAECLALLHQDDRLRFQDMLTKFFRTGESLPVECRAQSTDQGTKWFELKGHLTQNDEGQPIRFFGTSIDITERKRIEQMLSDGKENLRLAEESMRLATEAAKIGIWDYNPQSDEMKLTVQASQILGLKQETCSPLRWADMEAAIHPDDRQQVKDQCVQAKVPGGQGRCELTLRIIWPDGRTFWVLALGQSYFQTTESGDLKATRIIGTLLDVTEQTKLQEELKIAKSAAEAANATKSAFLANMSHEIRTPLGAILGFSNLLAEGKGTTEDREQYLRTIKRNGRSLLYIIDDILDLSKVEAGRLDLEKVPTYFHDLLAEVIDLFNEKAKNKGIFLTSSLEKKVPEVICTDPTRLKQILINLIGNAVKFTESGGVSVDVKTELDAGGRPQIVIRVKDTGIGLSAEQQQKLFQAFTQADNTTTRKFGGTGLGLYLAQKLAAALDGLITVEDCEVDRGCTFALSFALELPEGLVRAHRSEHAEIRANPPDSLQGSKILLAEDAPDNQLLIQTILGESGAAVEVANNGLEAVEMALHRPYDVVLMDLQMPLMDGYEATRILRREGYQRPIIALTAHGMMEERQKTIDAGCDHHLTKPLDPAELLDTIKYFL